MSRTDQVKEKNNKLFGKLKIVRASELEDEKDHDYIYMPDWWQKATNTKGLPFRKVVLIAGDSDSGKTSCTIEAMKAAQAQDVTILYVETEGKTTKEDLRRGGIDLDKEIYVLQESIAETVYSNVLSFMSEHKDEKLLVIVDSLGNILSKHDAERDMDDGSQKPGGKGKTNREGLNAIIAKRTQQNAAVLIVSYTYDNIGSPGKTNAGGKALNFFNSLCYQTTRKQWLERTEKGKKVRFGARVTWKLFKNHINRANPGPKSFDLDITSEGVKLVEGSDE